jgi:benzoate-CoA ligase
MPTSNTLNAADVILAKARDPRFRDRPAILHDGGTVTYGELDAMASRAANAFANYGLARGDRVCFLMKDTPLFCAAYLGAMRAGLVAVALNTRLAPPEHAFVVADSAARLLVADADFMDSARAAHGSARLVPARGAGESFERAVDAASPAFASAATDANDEAFWLYSSGTTGNPKGILHSHANAAHAGKLLREVVRADDRTVVLGTSKLFFAFGLDNAFLGVLSCGATTILNEGWPDPDAIVEQVLRYRPNLFVAVPAFFRRLLALPPERLAAMKTVPLSLTAGERLPEAVEALWRATVGTEILVVHGMSETFCNTFANFPGRSRPGTCGHRLDGVEAKLVDSDGRPAAAGEPGVLWVRHPSLALRYRSDEATARLFRDGWFCTGDLFTVDADGYWSYQGRADELIKVAGQWVKPMALEEAVLGDGRIREAAGVVVPDADGFDRLALFVVGNDLVPGEAARIAASRLAPLPKYSRPKWIREVAELPRTATGKVQRFRLRELLAAERGAAE